MLSTGVQFVLAETRTQEAGAPLPPISSLGRARDSYLNAAASVRETIAFTRMLDSERARTAAATAAYGAAEATASSEALLPSTRAASPSVNLFDDEFDSDEY